MKIQLEIYSKHFLCALLMLLCSTHSMISKKSKPLKNLYIIILGYQIQDLQSINPSEFEKEANHWKMSSVSIPKKIYMTLPYYANNLQNVLSYFPSIIVLRGSMMDKSAYFERAYVGIAPHNSVSISFLLFCFSDTPTRTEYWLSIFIDSNSMPFHIKNIQAQAQNIPNVGFVLFKGNTSHTNSQIKFGCREE